MNTDPLPPPICLFTLRIWLEELRDGQSEWRGQMQQVRSGEVRYFREWQKLVACLVEMLSNDKRFWA